MVAPVRRPGLAAREQRPFVDRRVERVEFVKLLMLQIPTAKDVYDLADGGHRDANTRGRNVAGDRSDRPGVFVEIEYVKFVVDGDPRRKLAAEGVGLFPYDCDRVGASCAWSCAVLIDLQQIDQDFE